MSTSAARLSEATARDAARDAARFAFNAAEAASPEGRTTLMLRNIPNKCTRGGLLAALAAGGVAAPAVDFVYLPVDFKHRCNLGYAFLNCTSAGATRLLHDAFHGRPWPEFHSRKVCAVTYARLQGRAALTAHFRAARFPAECDEALPLLLHHDDVAGGPPRLEVIGVRVPPAAAAAAAAAQQQAGAADADGALRSTEEAAMAAASDGAPRAHSDGSADLASLSLSEDADAGSGAEAEPPLPHASEAAAAQPCGA